MHDNVGVAQPKSFELFHGWVVFTMGEVDMYVCCVANMLTANYKATSLGCSIFDLMEKSPFNHF